MRRLTFLGAVVALVAMTVPASVSAAAPGTGTCSGGIMAGGTYSGFTVTGTCVIAPGATVHIDGDLVVAAGASLDDHGVEGWTGAQVHVTGDVRVGKGAVLGLGYNASEATLGPDTVGGDIVATQPLALQIGNVTVGGNLVSNGGGVLSTSVADFRNFPIKDNVIHGNLIVNGWQGGWVGLIRNHVDGNVIFTNNESMSNPETGAGTDEDSSEIMGSLVFGTSFPQTIGGNLVCQGNVPAAHVNTGDFGDHNVVAGRKIGECAGL